MIRFNYNIFSRKKIEITGQLIISAPASKAWQVMMLPRNLEYVNPFVKKHDSENWNGKGAKDSCEYYSGRIVFREAMEWKEGEYYFMRVTQEGKNNTAFVKHAVISINDNACEFSIEINSDAYRNIPLPVWHLFALLVVVPALKKYISSVLKGYEYHITTGKKVARNQFGTHKLFSPEA